MSLLPLLLQKLKREERLNFYYPFFVSEKDSCKFSTVLFYHSSIPDEEITNKTNCSQSGLGAD
jgi:hypothetical protein